ncbi:MAG: GNAT family N-acetyltransferase [Candidatus Acidiferrales bacterium]
MNMPQEWSKGEYRVSTDPAKLDITVIHDFLSRQSTWAAGIPLATVTTSIQQSLCFGLFHAERQIGFARVISDYATIAYLGDVFVIREYRGRGLSKCLMSCVMDHPGLRNMRRWILVTGDAHGLYRQFGFRALEQPRKYMEIHNPRVYDAQFI